MLVLKPNRERRLRNYHPWIFKDDVDEWRTQPSPGEITEVRASDGALVGLAYANPASSIPARIISLERKKIDLEFYRRKLS